MTLQGDQPLEPAPPPAQSRAGRNLPAAIVVSLTLGIGLILLPIYLLPDMFVVVVALAMLVGVWELCRALSRADIHPPMIPLLLGAVACAVGARLSDTEGLLVAFVLTVLAVFMWRLMEGTQGYVRDVGAGVFVAAYVPLLAGFAILMIDSDQGADRIVVFVVTTICSDVGGYATGVLFGRHPMAPRISPKKTWEGFAGSVGACVLGGSLTVALLLDEAWWKGALLGVLLCITATLGDLGESMIKRDIGVKDMGTLLPGHGGLMDRLDSLLPSAPVAWFVLGIIAPVP